MSVGLFALVGISQSLRSAPQGIPVIPSDVKYRVIEDIDNLNGTRTMRLEISRPVSAAVLRLLSEKVKANAAHEFQGATIAWYLPPGHFPNANPWASATYGGIDGPILKLKIYGFTEEQWFAMLADKPPANRPLRGEWVDGSESCRYRFFVDGGKKFAVQKRYADGSGEEKDVTLSIDHGHTRIDYLDPGHDDRWLIDDDGNLEHWDNDGMFSIAVKH